MPGDFDDRLAAVDDALADATGAREPEDRSGESDRDGGFGDGLVDDSTARGEVATGRGEVKGGGEAMTGSGEGKAGGGELAAGFEDSGGGVSADVAALADRVAELEAAVQALRGYVGSVRAVNDRVEERSDAAVASVESLRERVAVLERDSAGSRASGSRSGRERPRSRPAGGSCDVGEDCRGDVRGERDRVAGARGARSGGESGGESADRSDSEPGGVAAGGDGSRVAWPPAEPRAPYGEVDADDDGEQPGLVARLRDAL